jgi:hypothetical protein
MAPSNKGGTARCANSERSLGRSLYSEDPKGPTVNTLIPEDPASHRFEALVAALGTPALPGYEPAALARIVSWASVDDCAALTRLIRKARRDAFQLGRLNAQAEAEGGTE